MALILIVDDELEIRELLSDILERAKHETLSTPSGDEAVVLIHEKPVDLVLLDVNMPIRSGWETLRMIRDGSDVPVIILSSHASEMERVRGLRDGANDYMTKPFGRQELLARVWVRLRDRPDGPDADAVYEDEALRLDFPNREVVVRGAPVALTRLEFRLLASLVRHQDRVVGRDELITLVWGDPKAAATSAPKVLVSYVRKKLDRIEPGLGMQMITTVPNFGYRYVPIS